MECKASSFAPFLLLNGALMYVDQGLDHGFFSGIPYLQEVVPVDTLLLLLPTLFQARP